MLINAVTAVDAFQCEAECFQNTLKINKTHCGAGLNKAGIEFFNLSHDATIGQGSTDAQSAVQCPTHWFWQAAPILT